MNVPITLANGNTVELNNITESGSGYIRFSDGTQICYGLRSIKTNGSIVANNSFTIYNIFPKEFISNPTLSILRQQVNSDMSQLDVNIKVIDAISTVTGSYIRFISTSSYDQIFVDFSYIAIGRWK